MREWPAISIIIPSYNQGQYIERTFLSILNQDYPGKVQIIVSDGGSKDETFQILKKYDNFIRWWSEKDKGFADAVNKGLAVAIGDVVGIQSSDDYYLKNAFRYAIEGLAAPEQPSFVTGADLSKDENKNVWLRPIRSGLITPNTLLFSKDGVPQHATFVKREFLTKVGGARLEVDRCADGDLWFRISHLKPGLFVEKYLACYQIHAGQRTSQNYDEWYLSYVKMLESCEADPMYKGIVNLSGEERYELYTYWKIFWSGAVDPIIGKNKALEHIHEINKFSKRTQDVIKQYAYYQNCVMEKSSFFTNVIKASKDGTFVPKTLNKIRRIVKPSLVRQSEYKFNYPLNVEDLDWWNSQPKKRQIDSKIISSLKVV